MSIHKSDLITQMLNALPQERHPLSKEQCSCGEWVCFKVRAAHLESHSDAGCRPLPSDEEIAAVARSEETNATA